jgi:NADPH-dependent curcumin reductase CurA
MEGFLVFDYAKRYPEAAKEMAGWMAEGRLKSVEDMVTGMEQFPATLLRLYSGANFGKLILSVAGDAG